MRTRLLSIYNVINDDEFTLQIMIAAAAAHKIFFVNFSFAEENETEEN